MPAPPADPGAPIEAAGPNNSSEKTGSIAASILPAEGSTVAGSEGGVQLSDEKIAVQEEEPATTPAEKARGKW